MLLLRSHVMARLYDAIGISAFACKLLITLATLVVLGSRHHSPSKINLSVPAVGARSHMITHLMKEVLFLLLCTHFIFFFLTTTSAYWHVGKCNVLEQNIAHKYMTSF